MLKRLSFLFILQLRCFEISAQPPLYSLFLIGDTGEDTTAGPALQLLHDNLIKYDYNSGVVFLGDNIYPNGFDSKNEKSIRIINAQLNLLKDYHGYACFIPGNHDWKAQTKGGLKAVKAQAEYIERYLNRNRPFQNKLVPPFQPQNGLPGVATYCPRSDIRLIMIDTQWFLQYHKVGRQGTRKQTEQRFYKELDSILNVATLAHQQVIVMAHHPIFTNGYHSKSHEPFRFLVNYSPFQIFGLLGLNRLFSQDISQPRYRKMRRGLLDLLNKYGNVIYASGHDHTLQYFKDGTNRYIVSGAGSKLTKLQTHKIFKQEFESDTRTGFFKIEFFEGEKIKIIAYRVGENPALIETK